MSQSVKKLRKQKGSKVVDNIRKTLRKTLRKMIGKTVVNMIVM